MTYVENIELCLMRDRLERARIRRIVDHIDAGAVHRTGPVGGPLRDERARIRAREMRTIESLDRHIQRTERHLEALLGQK